MQPFCQRLGSAMAAAVLLRIDDLIRELFRKLYRVNLPRNGSLHRRTPRLHLPKPLLEEFADCLGQQFEIVFHVSATIISSDDVWRGGIGASAGSPFRQ